MSKPAKTFTYNDLRRALADWYADHWQTISDQHIKEQADYIYRYGITTSETAKTRHDQQIAAKAYDEGFNAGWADGWEDTDTRAHHNNPYNKDNT